MNPTAGLRAVLLLTAFWILLANELSLGQALLGLALSAAVLSWSAPLLPKCSGRLRVLPALRLLGVFLYDMVVANLVVARAALTPSLPIRPRILRVPLDIREPGPAAVLAALITLTPGTVSVDLDLGKRLLTVHGLIVHDEAAAVALIKHRYEARIREIWRC